MKKVRCISPHGGSHNGMYHNGNPVLHVWDAGNEAEGIEGSWKLPVVPPEKLRLPPNPGGYITCPSLGGPPIAVGSVIDVPDDWEINADHFEWVIPPDPPPPPPPAPAVKAEGA